MRHAPYSTFTDATSFAVSRATIPASLLRAGLSRLLWLLGFPRRVAAIRRDMALLGQMSGCELADIGLARQDLCDAAALPLGQSPRQLFEQRATERRRAAMGRWR